MKRIVPSLLFASILFVSQAAAAASAPVLLGDDLGQLLAPVTAIVTPSQPSATPITQSPMLMTAGNTTTAPGSSSTAPTTVLPINAIDMTSSYLTLAPLGHVSSYGYPNQKLSDQLTQRLYTVAAVLLGVGLLIAFGLIEAIAGFSLRIAPKKMVEGEVV